MAVKSYDRKDQPLEVLTAAERLLDEAMHLARNENIMPRKASRLLSDPLLGNVRSLMYAINAANSFRVDVNEPEEVKMRKQFQLQAKACLAKITIDLKITHKFTDDQHIAKFQNIYTALGNLNPLIRKWIKSDEARLANPQPKQTKHSLSLKNLKSAS